MAGAAGMVDGIGMGEVADCAAAVKAAQTASSENNFRMACWSI
jgi:alpha/beta superfamily hydrolase